MALRQSTIQKYVNICQAYHSGFSLQEIKVLLGNRIKASDIEAALAWERQQLLVRSEIQSLYDALIATRELRKKANLILNVQYNSVMARVRRFAIKEVQELIDAELAYSDRIRDLVRQVDDVSGHAGLESLPAGIFTEDIEPGGGDDGA